MYKCCKWHGNLMEYPWREIKYKFLNKKVNENFIYTDWILSFITQNDY